MKILFVAQNFQMGGIQKALINTLKEISVDKQYEIEVFTFGKGELFTDIPLMYMSMLEAYYYSSLLLHFML